MKDEKPIVRYICRECANEFDAPQGSRRTLCPECLVKAMNKEG